MKNNTFAEEYRKFKVSDTEYHAAEDEESKEAARKKARELFAEIDAKGTTYARIYTLYAEAQERGNEYIDLHDNIWDEHVKGVIDALREYGVEKFTFSSGWSSAVETAWLFLQNGCTLEGMIELHGSEKSRSGEKKRNSKPSTATFSKSTDTTARASSEALFSPSNMNKQPFDILCIL
ncbi:MAG: L-rhamnose mutarotase [Clostridia bacterium]|nr:L-rhamnose mutarotase [Clostridia bacterium]